MKNFSRVFYTTTLILTLIVLSIGSTYAYFAATIKSEDNSVATSSASFSINLSVLPKYPNPENGPYTIIPMKDELSEKGYIGYNETPCIDKNNAAVCYVYEIKVFGFSEGIEFVSGSVKVKTENISNLSYRLYDENNNEINLNPESEEIATKEDYNTPLPLYYDRLPSEEEKTLGDSHNIKDKEEITLYLMIWLSDTGVSQNQTDIGTFSGDITFFAGKGGQITGKISSLIEGSYTD